MVNHRVNDYNERSNRQLSHAVFSINDPRWGRGDGNGDAKSQDPKRPQEQKRPSKDNDGEGPPDLDEMWRDFNKKLAGCSARNRQAEVRVPTTAAAPRSAWVLLSAC